MRYEVPKRRCGWRNQSGKNSVLGNAVQDAVRADDRGVHGPGEHEYADHHNESAEGQPERRGPDQIHRQPADGIIEETAGARNRE